MVRNFGLHVKSAVDEAARLRLVDRVARSVIDYRSSRWPASPTLYRQQDELQRRCLCIACGSERLPGEGIDDWQRRRSRDAGSLARSAGLWSQRHSDRRWSWRQHIEREGTRNTMLNHVWNWRGQRWREEQRRRAGSWSALAGRLGSRAFARVLPRWEDSFDDVPLAHSA